MRLAEPFRAGFYCWPWSTHMRAIIYNCFGGLMRLRKVLGLLALAVFACPSLSIAQGTGSICGRVTDATSGGPLAAVQISIEGTRAGAQSGSDGNYSINGIPTGAQTLVVRRVGYSLQRIPITVGAGV